VICRDAVRSTGADDDDDDDDDGSPAPDIVVVGVIGGVN
jgi:hypothetical protein